MLRPPRPPDIYGCQTDDGVVVLDVSSGKYFAVNTMPASQPSADTFFRENAIHAVGSSVDIAHVVALESPPIPAAVTLSHVIALVSAILRVALGRALFGTGSIVRATCNLKGSLGPMQAPQCNPDLAAAIQAFRQMRPWAYTAHNSCLFDALVLTQYLLRLGFHATFVIGIRTRPFEAHAWTQIGTILVDDIPERVKPYTPIVVV